MPAIMPDHRQASQADDAQAGRRPKQQCISDVYHVTDEALGSGVNGFVMAAVHRESGRKVAIKTVDLSTCCPETRRDVQREIHIQSSLQHPKVARLLELYVSRANENLCLVMEHLEGGDVFEHFKEASRVFSEDEAISLIKQVLQAVEYLHEQGVVHRDIKLENTVYESLERDKVQLIDFGLSVPWREGDPSLSRKCGTRRYMAPEVYLGAYTNKCDLWCVGVMAHQLLTGEQPSWKSKRRPTLSRRLGKCSEAAQSFVAALLTVDPAARPSALEALRHRWLLGPVAPLVGPFSSKCDWSSLGSKTTETTKKPLSSPSLCSVSSFNARQWSTEARCPEKLDQDDSRLNHLEMVPEAKKSFWQKLLGGVKFRSAARSGGGAQLGSRVRGAWASIQRTKTASRVAPELQARGEFSGKFSEVVPASSARTVSLA